MGDDSSRKENNAEKKESLECKGSYLEQKNCQTWECTLSSHSPTANMLTLAKHCPFLRDLDLTEVSWDIFKTFLFRHLKNAQNKNRPPKNVHI